MDAFLMDYFNTTFLHQICDNSQIKSEDMDLTLTRWNCPCDITGVSSMPKIKFKLKNEELTYKFDQREYFFYPYYNFPST